MSTLDDDASAGVSRVPSAIFTPDAQDLGPDRRSVTPMSILPTASPPDAENEMDEVAIIGYSCRVPGNVNSPSELWSFLLSKGDGSGEMPGHRWDPYRTRQVGNAEILANTTSKGYFLQNLDHFDASFFGLSPREAEQMDPQQRISVETVWEALEHAGIPPQSLAGSDTAVFMGVNSDDYSRLLLEDLPNIEAWMGVGTAFCGIPNRISHLLDLLGPSSAVDAACASSLVAVHHGRQALRAQETSLVIAGGVNALIGPGLTRVLDQAGAISSDGRCRSFDESAAGYGRGEGAGIVIMKRLADAQNDGDQILTILKGSAVGADGRTTGIMAPNQFAQERVAKQALKEAGISPESISYVEAHATSTPVGDPTECAAMTNVYGSGARRSGSGPCYIGSIKPNIGHLEAGAGVMGLIKAMMILQEGVIPPQANLVTPSSKMDWAHSMLKVVTEPTDLPMTRWPRRAAIASYGYGGTVSHAVIEYPFCQGLSISNLSARTLADKAPVLLLLSAPSGSRFGNIASRLRDYIAAAEDHKSTPVDLQSLAYTLAVKRGHHKIRTAIVAETQKDAIQRLEEIMQNRQNRDTFSSRVLSNQENKGTVWVFSGHGAQWKHMGLSLLADEPAFVEVVRTLEPIIVRELGFSAISALTTGDFESTDKIQVLIYVVQVGLAAVLTASGLRPQAVMGHSHGEIAASVVAGALNLEEGALICCARARLIRSVAGSGAMVLVDIPFQTVSEELKDCDDLVAAIDSSPGSCVVSGSLEAIESLTVRWRDQGIQVRTVQTDTAFHSPMLQSLVDPLQDALEGAITPAEPRIPLYSTSDPDPRTTKFRDVGYWARNLIKPVLLNTTVEAAAQDGYRVFLEVSSHPLVCHSISETLSSAKIDDSLVIPTLLRNKDNRKSLLLAFGKLHCVGDAADYKSILPGKWLHDVPGTVWSHQSMWRQVTNPANARAVTHDVHAHVLLGARTPIQGTNTILWQTRLTTQTKPFPGKHPLHNVEIVPAAVLLNTFLTAIPGQSLHNVSLRVPVVVDPPREVQVILQESSLRIASRLINHQDDGTVDTASWLVNTTTQVSADGDSGVSAFSYSISSIKKRLLHQRLDDSFSIKYLAAVGVSDMGFPWKVIEHYGNENEMFAIVLPNPAKTLSSNSWASILDAATSISSTIFYKDPLLRMPTAIRKVSVLENETIPDTCYIYVEKTSGTHTANVYILSEPGLVLGTLYNLRFAGIEGDLNVKAMDGGLVHRLAWPPAQLAEEPLHFEHLLFISRSENPLLKSYTIHMNTLKVSFNTMTELVPFPDLKNGTVIIFIAEAAEADDEVYGVSAESCDKLIAIVKHVVQAGSRHKIFCITKGVSHGTSSGSLSQAPLHGLARIVKSEEPDVFGGLIDVEDNQFPMQAIKYVQGPDVIRIEDTVARNARLRPYVEPSGSKTQAAPFRALAHGTYVVTGGLGALGLEIASYLAQKGAKRLVLISRRSLPPRRQWDSTTDSTAIQRILALEAAGVSIYPLSVDMTAPDASAKLLQGLDALSLPPVLGVVHAAGVLANQLVLEVDQGAFNSVIKPKVQGALALHNAFPPGTLDFLVLFSSCGQLLGFTGQASYASGNAFLDTLATHRRNLGDNTVSMMWTSWRGLGMAASTRYIDAELHARGIADVTREEAFLAWEYIFGHTRDHAVILRALPIENDGLSPHPILSDMPVRKPAPASPSSNSQETSENSSKPKTQLEVKEFVGRRITHCVASTLSLAEESVDAHVALTELGMDSVMTVELRSQLQQALKMKVGPTIIWNHPTIHHLVEYFSKEMMK